MEFLCTLDVRTGNRTSLLSTKKDPPGKVVLQVVPMKRVVEYGLKAQENADEGLLKILAKVNGD